MTKIVRILPGMVQKMRVNPEDLRGMRLVDISQLNVPERISRYNYRGKDGIIQKYTVGDSFAAVTYLKKIGERYVEIFKLFSGCFLK